MNKDSALWRCSFLPSPRATMFPLQPSQRILASIALNKAAKNTPYQAEFAVKKCHSLSQYLNDKDSTHCPPISAQLLKAICDPQPTYANFHPDYVS